MSQSNGRAAQLAVVESDQSGFAGPGTLKFHWHSADKQDMKKSVPKSAILLAACLGYACGASAQTAGPTATPSSLSFSYTVNSTTLPAAATVKITLPAVS